MATHDPLAHALHLADPLPSAQILPSVDRDVAAARRWATANTGAQKHLRRRMLPTLLVATAALGGGVGVAAASGLLPARFSHIYADWHDAPVGVDPATAQRVASVPGPDGTIFTVITARNATMRCTAAVFERPASAARPAPEVFEDLGSQCTHLEDKPVFGTELGVSQTAGAEGSYSLAAGKAVAASLRLPDGTILPTVVSSGRIFGWFPASLGTGTAFLTASDENGTPIGSVPVRAPDIH